MPGRLGPATTGPCPVLLRGARILGRAHANTSPVKGAGESQITVVSNRPSTDRERVNGAGLMKSESTSYRLDPVESGTLAPGCHPKGRPGHPGRQTSRASTLAISVRRPWPCSSLRTRSPSQSAPTRESLRSIPGSAGLADLDRHYMDAANVRARYTRSAIHLHGCSTMWQPRNTG